MVKVASIFDCNSEVLFNEVKKTKSLFYIGKPLIQFVQLSNYPLPEIWEDGKYPTKMYMLGFIPVGIQWIVMTVDESRMYFRDNGYSKLIKKWDHKFYLKKIENDKTLYIDEVDINAGIFTPFIILFAHLFFRLRQRNWKRLIKNKFNYEN